MLFLTINHSDFYIKKTAITAPKFLPIFKWAHQRHNIGTVLLFPRKGIHAILGTVKNM